MTDSSTLASASGGRVPVVVVGAGVMGQTWVRMLETSSQAQLVGLVDLNLDLAKKVVDEERLSGVVTGASLTEVARASGASAVINVTVPQAHRPVNEEALRAGLPVLCEKPLAPSLSEALRQVALADITGPLLMVSQSRRYVNHLAALREGIRGLGALATVSIDYFREDHEPGFREEMAHPLLVDMSIHHFDAVRYLVDDEPIAVRCSSWNPPWSWYAGDAAATAEFELASGARVAYAGSRCVSGLQMSYNGVWRIYAERGAAEWDGESDLLIDGAVAQPAIPAGEEGIAGSLSDFLSALRTGVTPQNEIRSNILSLAMVEGAVHSSKLGGERVVLAELLDDAYATAIAEERRDDVSDRLRDWGSAAAGIGSGHWGTIAATELGDAQ